jgi:hypothetical protein
MIDAPLQKPEIVLGIIPNSKGNIWRVITYKKNLKFSYGIARA